jgi:ATP-dependent RNA helicase DDX1
VAARGIDILNLPFVVNCTLPDKPETYVHRVGRVGRAERIGLAVSLVSTVKERVWYCRIGNKPPCQDTRDFDAGGTQVARFFIGSLQSAGCFFPFANVFAGNCIWYDEPQFAGKIEQLLTTKHVLTKLEYPCLTLPDSVQALIQGKAYGERADTNGPLDPEVKAKLDEIKAQLDVLATAESLMQKDYWRIRHRFRKVNQ